MNTGLIIILSIYFGIALILSIGAITGVVSSVAFARSKSKWVLPMILILLLGGGAVGVLVSGRDLNLENAGLSIIISIFEAGPTARWINRGFIALLILLSIGVILGRLANRQRTPIQGLSLFFGFLIYYITMSLLPSVFGTEPAFLHHQIYPLLVLSAVFLCERPTPASFANFAKWLLFTFMAASLFVAVVEPDLVLQPNYHGWFPDLDYRLWGLASHANLIGPAALTLLLLEYMQPSRNIFLKATLILCALVVLVLAQSKTTWAAGLLAMGFLIAYRKIPELMQGQKSGIGKVSLSAIISLTALLLAFLSIIVGLPFMDMDRFINSIMSSDIGAGLETASGRDLIWETALEEWENNWLFGYGPLVWGDLYRFQHGMLTYAFHAHNQVLQTVSMGGGFALFGLLVYVWLLFRYSIRAAAATKGVSLALLLIVLVRSLSEVPFPQHALFSMDFLLHIVLFMILLLNGSPLSPREKSAHLETGLPISSGLQPPVCGVSGAILKR